MRYLIGIDIGTSATKTILMDEEGNVIVAITDQREATAFMSK